MSYKTEAEGDFNTKEGITSEGKIAAVTTPKG